MRLFLYLLHMLNTVRTVLFEFVEVNLECCVSDDLIRCPNIFIIMVVFEVTKQHILAGKYILFSCSQ